MAAHQGLVLQLKVHVQDFIGSKTGAQKIASAHLFLCYSWCGVQRTPPQRLVGGRLGHGRESLERTVVADGAERIGALPPRRVLDIRVEHRANQHIERLGSLQPPQSLDRFVANLAAPRRVLGDAQRES